MKEGNNGKTQEQAAVKANLRSRKTIRKYEGEKLGQFVDKKRCQFSESVFK